MAAASSTIGGKPAYDALQNMKRKSRADIASRARRRRSVAASPGLTRAQRGQAERYMLLPDALGVRVRPGKLRIIALRIAPGPREGK